MKKKIIGQDYAVDIITRAIKRGRLGLKDPNRPLGSYIFLGATGVGKTELSKVLACEVFDQDAFVRLDMSEYMEKQSVSKLIGSPPGYVGYEEGGFLTERIRRNPYSLILFDEIEKAHPEVYNILLQILDEGHLTDSKGNFVDFKNTIIIMTSNIGTSQLKQNRAGFLSTNSQKDYETMRSILMENLKRQFKPEFLNRVDEIVVFNNLTFEDVNKIAKLKVEEFRLKVTGLGYAVEIHLDNVAKLLAIKGYDDEYGARPLNRAVMSHLEDPFADLILNTELKSEQIIMIDAENNKTKFEIIGD